MSETPSTPTENVDDVVVETDGTSPEPIVEAEPAAEAMVAEGAPTDVPTGEEIPVDAAPAEEPAAEDVPTPAEDAPETAVPAPTPAEIAPASTPAVVAPAPIKPAEVPLDPTEYAAASAFGRVDETGTVFVTEAAGEREVGQFPDGTAEEALTFYVRRYLDLVAQVRLFESRIPNLSAKDLQSSLASLKEQVESPQAVGDLDSLRTRVSLLDERVAMRQSEIQAEREQARAEAMARREEIVAAAEAIADQDTRTTQWKDSGAKLQGLLEEWKAAQRSGPRLDKASEDALWKRFSKARTVFDRNRRQFFADRDAQFDQAKRAKEALIARAEALSSSTDWGRTSGEYRDLMNEWKAAGRARRKEDDELWARFRAAQQVFFDARDAENKVLDEQYAANLEVKLAILEEAEALLPVGDPREARQKLRALDERWEAAGRVPRSEVAKIEGRMRAVEKAIKDKEDAEWRRSNPETNARVSSATQQLEASIAALEQDLAKATAKGDARGIKKAEEALTARRAWLEQILKSNS